MTHDLLSETIRSLGAAVTEVRVTDSRNGVYLGEIRLRTPDARVIEVDSRPSDAVALALRAAAPIRVARRLLEEAPTVQVAPRDSAPDVVRVLGLTVVTPTPEIKATFQLPTRDGVVVLLAGGEGGEVGLRRGDLIIEVNGVVPRTPLAFFEAVRDTPPLQPARLRYWRDGREREVRVPLRARGVEPPARPRVEAD
jgi:S1-C subfamily serine protease